MDDKTYDVYSPKMRVDMLALSAFHVLIATVKLRSSCKAQSCTVYQVPWVRWRSSTTISVRRQPHADPSPGNSYALAGCVHDIPASQPLSIRKERFIDLCLRIDFTIDNLSS
jgi:hypothetical protein